MGNEKLTQPRAAKDSEGADAGQARREQSLSPHDFISEQTLPIVAVRWACYLPQSGQKTSALDVAISPPGALPLRCSRAVRTTILTVRTKPLTVDRTHGSVRFLFTDF